MAVGVFGARVLVVSGARVTVGISGLVAGRGEGVSPQAASRKNIPIKIPLTGGIFAFAVR
jgi:hypothetical protein